jgi:hypothetical protein
MCKPAIKINHLILFCLLFGANINFTRLHQSLEWTTMDRIRLNSSDALQQRKRKCQRLVLLAVLMSATTALHLIEPLFSPQPLHDSALTGQAWVIELVQGNPARMKTELGVYQHVFTRLVDALRYCGLTDTKHVSAMEQVAVFLLICVGNNTNQRTAGQFQRSGDTISRCILIMIFPLEVLTVITGCFIVF